MATVTALSDALQDKLTMPSKIAGVAASLGIAALLLAVCGLTGLVAFTVSERTREIGVRLALGARSLDVIRAIARPFIVPVVCGGLAGAVLAAIAATIMSSELFGISRLDPVTYTGAAGFFATVTAVAVLPSIRRSLRIDPAAALRHE
jgi:ABC-type antimicrobial peptide transport system permease subunit